MNKENELKTVSKVYNINISAFKKKLNIPDNETIKTIKVAGLFNKENIKIVVEING